MLDAAIRRYSFLNSRDHGGNRTRVPGFAGPCLNRSTTWSLPRRLRGFHRFSDLNRGADQVAPFRPGSVVVFHILNSQEIFQDEPAMAGALADAAVGDSWLMEIDAGFRVELAQLIRALKRAVFVGRPGPGDVLRARDVAGALRPF